MFLAFQAGLASSPGARGQGGEGAGYWAVAGWVSSDHGLLDAPEEAHGKDHEEKLNSQHPNGKGSSQVDIGFEGVENHRVTAL